MTDILSFSSQEIQVIWLTLKVALVSTIVTLPFAIWISWMLSRKKIPGKTIIESLITLPLVAPPVVTGYILLILLGRNGVLGKWFYESLGITMSFNFAALVLASVIVSLPLAVRTIKSAFDLIDPFYEQASRTLGASKIATFFRVSLPLALPGIISGMVLAFARCLGEFGATITFAGNIQGKTQTIALMVYSNMQVPGHELQVTRLVIVSVVISIVAIILSEYFNKRKRYLIR
jgi:molybdate transport system permease protein